MSTKESQINLRLPRELDRWLEEQAGGKRQKPSFIRQLLERERAKEEEGELQTMFDRAWDGLGEAEKEGLKAEREAWIGVYAGRREG